MAIAVPVVVTPPEAVASRDFAFIGWFFLLVEFIPVTFLAFLVVLFPAWQAFVTFYVNFVLTAILTALGFPPVALSAFTVTILVIALAADLFLLLLLTWALVMRGINGGSYGRARTAALIFGLLFLLTTNIVPGLFYLLAFARLGEVIAKYGPRAIPVTLGPAGPPPPPFFAPTPGVPVPFGPVPLVRGYGPYGPYPPRLPVPIGGGGEGSDESLKADESTHKHGDEHRGREEQPKGNLQRQLSTSDVAPKVVPYTPTCENCSKELLYSLKHKRWYCLRCGVRSEKASEAAAS